ncbi:MAG TPA: ABC transporter permease [Burkholderiales bacterium]|nr:ABC transporter permease [Burkholderiales bacterium]
MGALFTTDGRELVVAIPERGVDPAWLARPLAELGLHSVRPLRTVRVQSPAGWRWGTPDAAFFARLLRELETPGQKIMLEGLPQQLAQLLALARGAAPALAAESAPRADVAERIGLQTLRVADDLRAFLALLGEVVMLLPRFFTGRAKMRRAELVEVLAESSSRALAIVAVVNVLMGAILAFVGAVQLKAFGAGIYVANLVGIASVRELTPILVAIVLAGRTGASFAARIATMQGNEEVDALTTLGVSPAEFLVLPRVVALGLLMPLLYIYGVACALAGGMLVAMPILDLSMTAYAAQTQHAIGGAHFVIGALKALLFGGLVALIGCHHGLRAARSAAGVGAATTAAVVNSIIGVIALDAVFAVCANALKV